jgi:hypothetical protein
MSFRVVIDGVMLWCRTLRLTYPCRGGSWSGNKIFEFSQAMERKVEAAVRCRRLVRRSVTPAPVGAPVWICDFKIARFPLDVLHAKVCVRLVFGNQQFFIRHGADQSDVDPVPHLDALEIKGLMPSLTSNVRDEQPIGLNWSRVPVCFQRFEVLSQAGPPDHGFSNTLTTCGLENR